nr:hypothetical protein [uncultured Flavobacterium sp.]
MNLQELLEQNKRVQEYQDSLPVEKQIELLEQHKKSVFTFHMEDGRKLIRGDSESDQEEMKLFFENYPQKGVSRIEFHK